MFISTYKAHILHDHYIPNYIPNPAQYLNLTTLLTINKRQIIETKVIVHDLLIVRIGP